jgi:hypothetical protein
MPSFSLRSAKYFYDKPLPKYLDPKTVLIYRPHPALTPLSPSPPGECVPPAFVGGGGTHSPGGEGGGGSIFWKTRDIGLPSYSNNLSTLTKLSPGGNYDVIYKLFLRRESLVSDIPAGYVNIEKFFMVHFLRLSTVFTFFNKRSVYKNCYYMSNFYLYLKSWDCNSSHSSPLPRSTSSVCELPINLEGPQNMQV